jgi:hypothetical protein
LLLLLLLSYVVVVVAAACTVVVVVIVVVVVVFCALRSLPSHSSVMPPEPPSGNFLCRLLRHEYVRQYSKALCSDAYSNFVSRKDIKRVTYSQDVSYFLLLNFAFF